MNVQSLLREIVRAIQKFVDKTVLKQGSLNMKMCVLIEKYCSHWSELQDWKRVGGMGWCI